MSFDYGAAYSLSSTLVLDVSDHKPIEMTLRTSGSGSSSGSSSGSHTGGSNKGGIIAGVVVGVIVRTAS